MPSSEILDWVNSNGAVVGLVTFFLGSLLGHWLSIGRDVRKHRADTFNTSRSRLLNARHPVRVDMGEADAIVQAAPAFRRRAMGKAIERCNKAANYYHNGTNAWGEPTTNADSEREMRDAVSALITQLRRI